MRPTVDVLAAGEVHRGVLVARLSKTSANVTPRRGT